LKRTALRRYKSRKKIPILPETARIRKKYVLNWRRCGMNEQLQNVIFSDECSVQRRSYSGDRWVWRLYSEAYRRDLVNLVPHVKDISQMVWAGIWLGGRTKLVIMNRDYSKSERGSFTTNSYLEALEEGLIQHYTPETIFQQDNARIHKSANAREWFETHGIHVIDWPAHSPDLNPIEPVWRLLKLKLFELYPELGDMGRSQEDWKQFKRAIAHAWDVLDQSVIDGLIRSVPKRIEAVRIAKGYYTRY
jgi:hypothetical protein